MSWPERYYAKHQGQTCLHGHNLRDPHPVYLRVKHGGQLYVGLVGQGSGQRRNFQDDFTGFFHTHRRHDWVPEWYQTEPRRHRQTEGEQR